jgi:hypothetical protein
LATDLILRLRALFTRTTVDQEIDDELQFHVDRQIELLKKTGLDEGEATRRAPRIRRSSKERGTS